MVRQWQLISPTHRPKNIEWHMSQVCASMTWLGTLVAERLHQILCRLVLFVYGRIGFQNAEALIPNFLQPRNSSCQHGDRYWTPRWLSRTSPPSKHRCAGETGEWATPSYCWGKSISKMLSSTLFDDFTKSIHAWRRFRTSLKMQTILQESSDPIPMDW